jgi:crossover junction endodeoxyribonuclease RuvC
MIILGIDPGTLIMGYGIIESQEEKIILVKYGIIKTAGRSPTGERLSYLYNQLIQIISKFDPDAVAIEEPFVAKNARSALAIGKAQAVAILAAANLRKPCYEYSPAESVHLQHLLNGQVER